MTEKIRQIANEALVLIATGLIEQSQAIEAGKLESAVQLNPYVRQGWEKLSYVCFSKGKLPPRTLPELVGWLRQPVLSWAGIGELFDLDSSRDEPLLEDAFPSYLCETIGDELAGVLDTRLELEDQYFRKLKQACHELHLVADYSAAREFLIRAPILTDVIAQISASGRWHPKIISLLRNCYEEIPEACLRRRGQQQVVYRCPHCGWALEWRGNEATCVKGGVCGQIVGDLRDAAEWLPYEPGMMRTREGIQRFVVQPELTLIEMVDNLRLVPGIICELFPEIDAYDLRVTFVEGGQRWAVDAKDVRSPSRLAKTLNDSPFTRLPIWDQAFYLIPDYRATAAYLQRFRTHWNPQPDVRVKKMSSFARLVRRVANGEP
jgi:hypothetical protein